MAKKRANREGNIRKRKNGRWEGHYAAGYDPKAGKRIIENLLGKTQAERKAKLTAASTSCCIRAHKEKVLFSLENRTFGAAGRIPPQGG